jgi:hypothetical protein
MVLFLQRQPSTVAASIPGSMQYYSPVLQRLDTWRPSPLYLLGKAGKLEITES